MTRKPQGPATGGSSVTSAIERTEYALVNLNTYPWRDLPDVTLEREGDRVTIATAGRPALSYAVVAQRGPHLLLRRR